MWGSLRLVVRLLRIHVHVCGVGKVLMLLLVMLEKSLLVVRFLIFEGG